MQDVEAGFIGGKPRPLDLHAPEGADVDFSFRRTAPWASPVFKLCQLNGCLLDEIFDNILLAQPVAAADSVVEVVVQVIFFLLDACRAAFGGYGMAAHRIDFRYQCDFQCGIGLGDGDCRT